MRLGALQHRRVASVAVVLPHTPVPCLRAKPTLHQPSVRAPAFLTHVHRRQWAARPWLAQAVHASAKGPVADRASWGGPDFDKSAPELFYLPRSSLAALSDAVIRVGKVRLPVHSSVLASASPVLEEAFRAAKEGGASQGPVELIALEEDLLTVAIYLRLCYRPESCCAEYLDTLTPHLPGLLRLAYKLEAHAILHDVVLHMLKAQPHGAAQLVEFVNAAADCGLEKARALGMHRLGRLFLAPGLLSAADAQLLVQRLQPEALAALLDDLANCQNDGGTSWLITEFEAKAAAGGVLESPLFAAAGAEWQLRLYPGGVGRGQGGYLSMFLECLSPEGKLPRRARVTFTVHARDPAWSVCHSSPLEFTDDRRSWGFEQLISEEHVRDGSCGFLDSGCLRLSVTLLLI